MAKPSSSSYKRQYKYYEILGITKEATQEEITQAYRKEAKTHHPDVDPSPESHKKMAKINEAYEVLSNVEERKSYDSSPVECDKCWTHRVIQTKGMQWRCTRCRCPIGTPKGDIKFVEKIEIAQLSPRARILIEAFQETQCSWCKKFYTQPPLCPFGTLQSNCIYFDELDSDKRRELLGTERWWWWMIDRIKNVQEKGTMTKCRNPECKALNPNPQKFVCWRCGLDTLRCPKCDSILYYYVEEKRWKCSLTSCSKKFAIVKPKTHNVEETLSRKICPNCGNNLYYDAKSRLLKCKNPRCRRVYTLSDLTSKKEQKGKTHANGEKVEFSTFPPDLTPLTMGIEENNGLVRPIIKRNTKIPVSKSIIMTTSIDNQTSLEVHVLQGERPMSKDNKTIGRFMIDGIMPAPRGVPQIEATFDLDANGILNVSARDKGTGKEQKITITASSGLSKEEVERMVKEAEKYATKDAKNREKMEIRNTAYNILDTAEKILLEYDGKVSVNLKKQCEERITRVKVALQRDNIAYMRRKIQELSDALQQIRSSLNHSKQQKAASSSSSSIPKTRRKAVIIKVLIGLAIVLGITILVAIVLSI